MKIAIFNQKGGVGKTMLATQIALYFDLKIVELDPYGILKSLMPERVIKLGLRDKISDNLDDVVFDFGSFDGLILNEFNILFISTVQTVENEIISIIDLPKPAAKPLPSGIGI